MGGKGSGNPDIHKHGKKFSKEYQPDPERLKGKRTKTILRELFESPIPIELLDQEKFKNLKGWLKSFDDENMKRMVLASAMIHSIEGSAQFFKLLMEVEGSIGKVPEDISKMSGLDKPIGDLDQEDWMMLADLFRIRNAKDEIIDIPVEVVGENQVDKVFNDTIKKLNSGEEEIHED